jgi:hypothetical protein
MLNLIELWNNVKKRTKTPLITGSKVYPDSASPGAINFDNSTVQSSFDFDEPPNVVFVHNLSSLAPVVSYHELEGLNLSNDEKAIRETFIDEQKDNPKFYDGEQMLIADAAYDRDSNTVFLVANKVPYSIIMCLSRRRFPESSPLYQLSLFKTGVLAPLVTTDGQTFLLQRQMDTLFSVPAGFLEPHGDEKRLNLDEGDNLVRATARAEITEEMAGIEGHDRLRFEFSEPEISAVSFRSSSGPIGTIEFVAPSYAHCDSRTLEQVVNDNRAPDALEHTGVHEIVPLDSSRRDELLGLLLKNTTQMPGAALFLPVVLSLTKIWNQATSMIELPRHVPNSSSHAFPIRLFHAQVPKLMAKADNDVENEDQKNPTL